MVRKGKSHEKKEEQKESVKNSKCAGNIALNPSELRRPKGEKMK